MTSFSATGDRPSSSPARRRPNCRSRSKSASRTGRRITAAPRSPRAGLSVRAGAKRARTRRRHPSRRGAAPGGCVAAGSVGRARERRVRAVAAAHRDRAGRHAVRADPGGPRAPSRHAHRRRPDAQVSTRAVEPSVFATPGAPPAPTGKRPPPVAGRPRPSCSICRGAWGADGVAVARGRGRSVAGRGRDLALRRRRELRAAPDRRSTRHDRAHPDGVAARPVVAMGSASHGRGGTVLRALWPRLAMRPRWRAATCSPCRGRTAAGRFFRRLAPNSSAHARYRLSRLLRGLAGSEPQAARSVPSGATIVRLDEAVDAAGGRPRRSWPPLALPHRPSEPRLRRSVLRGGRRRRPERTL